MSHQKYDWNGDEMESDFPAPLMGFFLHTAIIILGTIAVLVLLGLAVKYL